MNTTLNVEITRSDCDHVAGEILYTGNGENAPTCTKDGKGHRECTICHETIESGIVVKAAHRFSSAWTIDVPATTTSEGSKSHHCSVCGEKNDITVIPKLVISSGGNSNSGSSSGRGEKNKAVRFTEQYLNAVTTLATEYIQCMSSWFFFQLAGNDGTQTVNGLSHIGISCNDIDIGCNGDITKRGSFSFRGAW